KAFVVERGLVLPQKRTPLDWTEQLTSPPKTLPMSAAADGTTTSAAIATINPASFRMRLLSSNRLPSMGPPGPAIISQRRSPGTSPDVGYGSQGVRQPPCPSTRRLAPSGPQGPRS